MPMIFLFSLTSDNAMLPFIHRKCRRMSRSVNGSKHAKKSLLGNLPPVASLEITLLFLRNTNNFSDLVAKKMNDYFGGPSWPPRLLSAN